MNAAEEPANIRQLLRFHVYTSAAIAIVASGVTTDLLLLRMDFNLARFGVIKSSIYLVPALLYLCCSGRLQRWNQDRLVCLYAYLIRVLLPMSLPLIALTSNDKTLLLWSCIVVFALSYSCALFANNSLLSLFRQTISPGRFNRLSVFFGALLSVPSALLCIPAAWYLSTFDHAAAHRFFLAFLGLEAAAALFEIPAIRAMRRLRVDETQQTTAVRWRDFLRPLADGGYRRMLQFNFLHCLWLGMFSCYFVVFLLRIVGLNPGWIVLIELGLAGGNLFLAQTAGKLADRFRYPAVFGAGTVLLLLCTAVWSMVPQSAVALWLLILLVYNGNGGLLSGTMRQLGLASAARLAAGGNVNISIAVFSLCQAAGCFSGCLLAGFWFGWLEAYSSGAQLFRFYFLSTSLLLLAMWWAAGNWQKWQSKPRKGRPL